MRKQLKKVVMGTLAALLVVAVGISTGGKVSAATAKIGAVAALEDSNYSLEEMLVYAITDENLAKAEYDAIIGEYGVVKPFSNIIKAEKTHISLLLPLLTAYKVTVPDTNWDSKVTVPTSLTAAYKIGVDAEIKNIAMYEKFLKEDLPADVRVVFEKLMKASKNHLRAFRNAVDQKVTGKEQKKVKLRKNGMNSKAGQGCGQGKGVNRNKSKGSKLKDNCLL